MLKCILSMNDTIHLHHCREARLRQELQTQSEEQQRLQTDYQAAVEARDQVQRERASLQRSLDEATSSVTSLSDQLGRYKTIEQRLFDETQSYQSQLEALKEEKSKLAKVPCTVTSPLSLPISHLIVCLLTVSHMQECANLAKENAAISGHQNLRQKIHYHATTKLENSRLKEVCIYCITKNFCDKKLSQNITQNFAKKNFAKEGLACATD